MEVTLQSSPKENVRTVTASTCGACGDADLLLGTPAHSFERDHKKARPLQGSLSPLSAAHRSIVVHQQQEKQRRSGLPGRRNVQSLQHHPDGEAADFSSAADSNQQQTSGILSLHLALRAPPAHWKPLWAVRSGRYRRGTGRAAWQKDKSTQTATLTSPGTSQVTDLNDRLESSKWRASVRMRARFPFAQWFTGLWCWRTATASSPAPTSCRSPLQPSRPSPGWPSSAGER